MVVYIYGIFCTIDGCTGVGREDILSSMGVYEIMKKTWTLGLRLPVSLYDQAVAEATKLIFDSGRSMLHHDNVVFIAIGIIK